MFISVNTVVFRLLLLVVLLAPLPLGSNRPWAWSLLAVLVGTLIAGWSLLVLAGGARAPVPLRRLWAVALPFALVVAWALLQTTALPPPDWWHPLWAEGLAALGRPPTGAISPDPEMTRAAVLRLVSYGGIFWLAVQLGRDRLRAREALVAVALAGVAYAGYGLVGHLAGWERILWLEKWAYLGDLTSTFVNRNAYGAYAGLGVLCCVALFMHALRPPRTGQERRAYDLAEALLLGALPYLTAALVIGSALLLSHSRGAFLSTGLALGVLIVLMAVARIAQPRTALVLGVVVLATGFAALTVSGDITVKRLAETASGTVDEARPELYRLTGVAIMDAPWTGHGYGAFAPAFRMYRDTALSSPSSWDHAHNVHLEAAMDLGLPATALLYVALAVILVSCAHGLTLRRRDQIYPAVALAAATLLGAHGAVDFSVQMPGIAATLALLLGVGYAQSWRSTKSAEASD